MAALTIIANEGSETQTSNGERLAEGVRQCGDVAVMMPGHGQPKTKHVACWGWRRGKKLRQRGHEVLVVERGYLGDRFKWLALGWNGLNGKADFRLPSKVDAEKFNRHFRQFMKPWKSGGDYVLIMGQVPGDMSIEGVAMNQWYVSAASEMEARFGLPVYIRPHPAAVQRRIWTRIQGIPELKGTLDEAFARARCVVTYNSNSGTDAVMAGVPVIMQDRGGMAWPVSAQGLNADIITPDRGAWAERLSWCQWNDDELSSGAAWHNVSLGKFDEALDAIG